MGIDRLLIEMQKQEVEQYVKVKWITYDGLPTGTCAIPADVRHLFSRPPNEYTAPYPVLLAGGGVYSLKKHIDEFG